MTKSTKFAELRSDSGKKTSLGYDFGALFEDLAKRGEADVAIVSTEDGFSPLGGSSRFFEEDLQVPYDKVVRPLANWNRFENSRVTLVAIPTRNPQGLLRGLVLAPGNNTVSYNRFGAAYGRPHRSYYYNVAYEAIAFVCRNWGAKKIGISHLSGSGAFQEDMATCQAEALAHFCDSEPVFAPESFIYCGCCITLDHLKGIHRLNAESGQSRHHSIRVDTEMVSGATLLHLDWSGESFQHARHRYLG